MPNSKFSTRTMRDADWLGIRYFKKTDFKNPERMGYEFIRWLDSVRVDANVPMVITSSYRSPAYNRSVGGAADSAHTDDICNSVDIGMRPRADDPNWNLTRYRVITSAQKLGCRRFGLYSNGSLHLDRTEDIRPAPRMWVVVSGHP